MTQLEPGPPKSARGNPSLGDILRSVAVMAAIVLVAALVGLFFTRTPDAQSRAVDYKTPLAQAATISTFDLLAPGQLPDGWIATSVSFDPGPKGRWHIGTLTEDGDYVGLEQSPRDEQSLLDEFSPKTSAKGDVEVAGQTWQLRTSGSGETSLVRRDSGVTVLVTGTAPRKDIDRFAESLIVRTAGAKD
ncbi:MAG: hypothetical protein JWP10_1970 [Nocardioidaceae bacterium]|nr:hypothetical protein [Nocardioidaceae bacterium]